VSDRLDIVRAKRRTGRLRRELLRRRILEDDPAEGLCRLLVDILGLTVKPFHEKLIEFDHQPNHEALALAGRGYGKSTVLTIARSIREVLRNPNIRILIASKTAGRASDFLREISNHLRFNATLISVFGEQYDHRRIHQERTPWSATSLSVAGRSSFSKEPNIRTTGIGGQVQGGHYDLIFGDDLVTEENSQTEGQRAKLEQWYGKVLYPTIDATTTQVRFRGTRFHPLDLYGRFIEDGMSHLIVRSLEDDGSTPWPEKFSTEFLEGVRERRGSAVFNAQYQNDTELMKGQMFRESWFRYWKQPPEWEDESGKKHRSFEKSDSWLGGDPAATKKDVLLTARKADTDWWTFAVASRHYDESAGDYRPEFYFRKAWRGRVTKNEYLERVVRAFSEFDCVLVAMEDVAAQEHLCQDLEAKVPLRRVGRPTDKVSRGYSLQPFFENGQVLFPHDSVIPTQEERDTWRALREELLLFPDTGVHDDLFDAVETTVHASVGAGIEVFSA
jgi:predicted phage terminase large subunit-like protein